MIILSWARFTVKLKIKKYIFIIWDIPVKISLARIKLIFF